MRDMDRWLGDGGMPLLTYLGASIDEYGEGWAAGRWVPTAEACNPAGAVQSGAQSVVLDAAVSFAQNTLLQRGDRIATLELKVSTVRASAAGDELAFHGSVVRLARGIGFVEGRVTDAQDRPVATASATFIVRRKEDRTP